MQFDLKSTEIAEVLKAKCLKKMKVCVTIVEEQETNEFNLPDDALISNLKKALEGNEGVPNERICLYFKTTAGHDVGMFWCSIGTIYLDIEYT